MKVREGYVKRSVKQNRNLVRSGVSSVFCCANIEKMTYFSQTFSSSHSHAPVTYASAAAPCLEDLGPGHPLSPKNLPRSREGSVKVPWSNLRGKLPFGPQCPWISPNQFRKRPLNTCRSAHRIRDFVGWFNVCQTLRIIYRRHIPWHIPWHMCRFPWHIPPTLPDQCVSAAAATGTKAHLTLHAALPSIYVACGCLGAAIPVIWHWQSW